MPLKLAENQNDSYYFLFQNTIQNEVATILGIGYEEQNSHDYYWDSKKHDDEEKYIFQYTLSGSGICEINNIKYEVSPGKGFFINFPSNIRYYFPENGEKWNFIFITLSGKEAKKCWDFICQTRGAVLNIPSDSLLIQQLLSTHKDTAKGNIDDSYLASQKAYAFIMECYRHFKKKEAVSHVDMPDNMMKALVYMHTRYHEPLTLEDIANEANVSKFYFIKKFKECMYTSPLQYLTKYRLKKAIYFLQHTDKTVKEISKEVGFSNPNYFCKVFRSFVGTSPNVFRQNTCCKHLITD